MSFCIQLDLVTIYLKEDVSVLVYPDGQVKTLTTTELKVFLHLLKVYRLSRYCPLSAGRLAFLVNPYSYRHDGKRAEQAIREHISNIRNKLNETLYHPSYLKGSIKQGYWLHLPERSYSFSAQDVQQLIDSLD